MSASVGGRTSPTLPAGGGRQIDPTQQPALPRLAYELEDLISVSRKMESALTQERESVRQLREQLERTTGLASQRIKELERTLSETEAARRELAERNGPLEAQLSEAQRMIHEERKSRRAVEEELWKAAARQEQLIEEAKRKNAALLSESQRLSSAVEEHRSHARKIQERAAHFKNVAEALKGELETGRSAEALAREKLESENRNLRSAYAGLKSKHSELEVRLGETTSALLEERGKRERYEAAALRDGKALALMSERAEQAERSLEETRKSLDAERRFRDNADAYLQRTEAGLRKHYETEFKKERDRLRAEVAREAAAARADSQRDARQAKSYYEEQSVTLSKSLEIARREAVQARNEAEETRAQAKLQLAEAKSRSQELESQLQELQKGMAALQEAAGSLRGELTGTTEGQRRRIDGLEQENARLRAELEKGSGLAGFRTEQLVSTEKDLAQARTRIIELQAELERTRKSYPIRDLLKLKEADVEAARERLGKLALGHPDRPKAEAMIEHLLEQRNRLAALVKGDKA